jgi:hypothetical protein
MGFWLSVPTGQHGNGQCRVLQRFLNIMEMEDRIRITTEVAIGRSPSPATPDDSEMAALRSRLTAERAAIASAGHIMDPGYDWEEAEPGKWGYWEPKGNTKGNTP